MSIPRHHCHAFNCTAIVPPKMLMCLKHWRMVPQKIQVLIWKAYRPGQEIDKQPSRAYLLTQRSAVWAVFVEEGGCLWTDVPEIGSDAYMIGPAALRRSITPANINWNGAHTQAIGECPCSYLVRSDEKACVRCGVALDWSGA